MNVSQIILLISCVTTIAMSTVIWVIARNYPKNIQGINAWIFGSFTIGSALCFILAREHLPPLLGIFAPNLMILLALMLFNAGTRRFAGYPPRNIRPLTAAFITLFTGLFAWFTFIEPDVATRMMIIAIFILVVSVDYLIFGFLRLPNSIGRNLMLLSLLGLILTRLIRLFTLATGIDQPISVFDNSISQLLVSATPAVLVPLTTISFLLLASERVNQDLIHAVRHDGLTGCLNRNAGSQVLENEIARANRYQSSLSILFMDLDDFKLINDTHGHLVGDQVLKHFASEVRKCMRNTDYLFRFGGDEFIAILPNTTIEDAIKLSNRINQVGISQSKVKWTASIGAAQWQGESDKVEQLIERADQSAYRSKRVRPTN